MANLNQQVDTPIAARATGVTQGSTGGGFNAATAAVQTLTAGMSIFSQALQQKATASTSAQVAAQGQILVGEYINRQAALAGAVSSGEISEAKASVKSRAMFKQFSAANPTYSVALGEAHNTFIKPSLGPLIEDANENTRAIQARREKALEAGAVDPTQPTEIQDQQQAIYNSMLSSRARMEAIDTQDEVAARGAWTAFTGEWLKTFKTTYSAIVNNPAFAGDTATALESLEFVHAANLDEVDIVSANIGESEDAQYAISILNRNFDIQKRLLLGEVSREAADAELDNIKSLGLLAAVNTSPILRKQLVISALNISHEALLVGGPAIYTGIAAWMLNANTEAGSGGVTPNDLGDVETASVHLEAIMKPSIAKWRNANTPELQAQLIDNMSAGIQGSVFVRDAKAGRDYMTYISDKDIGEFMVATGDETLEFRLEARDVLQGVYGSELRGIIQQEVDNTGLIRLEWSDGQARFVTDVPGGARFYTVNRLNQKLKPLLNDYIRGMSHLSGHKDYKRFWDESIDSIVPNQVRIDALNKEFRANKAQRASVTPITNPESDQIKSDEGTVIEDGRHVSYVDKLGKPTGGFGHLLTAEEITEFPEGSFIPTETAEDWYIQDLKEAEADAQHFLGGTNVPAEVLAIVQNMAFNLGRSKLDEFELFKAAIDKGDWDEAANEMVNSKWFKQVGNRSERLVRRMQRLGRG